MCTCSCFLIRDTKIRDIFICLYIIWFVLQELQQIVINLQELHEISAQLVGSLEECIEMSGEDGEQGAPQAGFIFEEIAEVSTTTEL